MLFPFGFFCSHSNSRRASSDRDAFVLSLAVSLACLRTVIAQNFDERVFVTDSTDDRGIVLEDRNESGTFEPEMTGEVEVYYDDSSEGPDLSNPSHLARDESGVLYLLDGGTLDVVLTLVDINGDGDANDVVEVQEFYSSESGAVELRTPNTMIFGPDGGLYIADDSSTAPRIVRLEDLNRDGDAMDEGEAAIVYELSAFSVEVPRDPESIAFGADGTMYVGDSTSQAIFAMTDRDGDGTFLGAQEIEVFYQSPTDSPMMDIDCLAVLDRAVFFCDEDTGLILRLYDANGDGAIASNEVSVFLDGTAERLVRDINDFALLDDGRFFALDGAADTLFLIEDLSGDGDALDEGEVIRLIVDDGATLATPSALAVRSSERVTFIRGETTGDGTIGIGDPILILAYLFSGAEHLGCLDAADSNDDGAVDITDAIYVLSYLFAGGLTLPPPHPEPGIDPTEDSLVCELSD